MARWTVGPGQVTDGDRIFGSHVKWMTGHPAEGDTVRLAGMACSRMSPRPTRTTARSRSMASADQGRARR